jgi:hypothetical protein
MSDTTSGHEQTTAGCPRTYGASDEGLHRSDPRAKSSAALDGGSVTPPPVAPPVEGDTSEDIKLYPLAVAAAKAAGLDSAPEGDNPPPLTEGALLPPWQPWQTARDCWRCVDVNGTLYAWDAGSVRGWVEVNHGDYVHRRLAAALVDERAAHESTAAHAPGSTSVRGRSERLAEP